MPFHTNGEGPNFLILFQDMKCLNGEANAEIIVSYLRFFKNDEKYQKYLNHYLPMLKEEDRAEFLPDVTRESTLAKIETLQPVEADRVLPETNVTYEPVADEAPKKKGRPSKKTDEEVTV